MPCKPAVCSHSLGRAWVHDMPSKLDQAARYGLDIELFYEDLLYVAKELPGGPTPENHLEAARYIRELCDERSITIMCLQPFMHYDGLRDRQKHAERVEEMKLWIELAKILGTNLIAIPSTCLPDDQVSGDKDLIASDMREVADLGKSEGILFAYEALCWGTHVDLWEDVWDIVQRVDRSNFGMCVDTYNLAGRVYADPTSPNGKTPNADADMAATLQRLVQIVDVKKIFYVQVVDAQRLSSPLVEGHELYSPDQCARMSWSRNCRLFYSEDERGAYLPISDVLEALLVGLGFEGYLSAELFNASLMDEGAEVPAEHARRAAESYEKIVDDFGLHAKTQTSNAARIAVDAAPRAQL